MWFNIIRKDQKKLFTDNVQEDLEGNVKEGKEFNPKFAQQSKEITQRKKSKKLHQKKIDKLFPKNPPKGQTKLCNTCEEE